MTRLEQVRKQLRDARKELEFIAGQLFNEDVLIDEGLSDLTHKELKRFMAQNDKLLTTCIQLEVSLEELVD